MRRAQPADGRDYSRDSSTGASRALTRLPVLHPAPALMARSEALQRICEELSPQAVVEQGFRLLITGCRPGDGASTIAAALALDLSQRLSLRTLVIDANARRPTLQRTLSRPNWRPPELLLDGPLQIRPTGWAWLDLATFYLGSTTEARNEALQACEQLSRHYAAVVVDLGVVRLDARMLPLAREHDPILVITRYGHTRRQELATTAAALRAARRSLAGAILNGVAKPVTPQTKKKLEHK
jgi:Mrp family chromosome partitioning ATPase